jgi:hypothetical protein
MSRKIVVEQEQVVKLAYTTVPLFSGEEQKRITATLECGDRIVMREGEALFQSIGLYLRQGDILSFMADEFDVNRFKPEGAEKDIVLKELKGLKDVTVEAGIWSDAPVEALKDRAAAINFAAPRTKTAAPPIGGAGNFTAPPVGAETAPAAATGTTQF